MKTYAAFDEFITSGARHADGYRHVNSIRATVVQRRGPFADGVIGVFYHGTCVVEAHQDGTFTLFTGGYRTATTKARINDFSPARVYQHKGIWYLGWFTDGGTTQGKTLFVEGMRVTADGLPL